MRAVDTGAEADAADADAAARGRRGRPAPSWLTAGRATHAAVLAVTALALGLTIHTMALPHALTGVSGYDDGVYFGSALRLVHGDLPYRAFDYLHPPGMPLLMAPVALLGDLVGAPAALGIARVLTGLAACANVALVGYLLRRRGVPAVLLAGVTLAVFPLAVACDATVLLEPWLLLFCLLGALVLFGRPGAPTARRVLVAGLLFGFAGTVKIWAVVPFLAAVLVAAVVRRRSAAPLVAGAALGFAVPTLPFFLAAPTRFGHDVFVVQATRASEPAYATSASDRLLAITGVHVWGAASSSAGVIVLAVIGVLTLVAVVSARGRLLAIEWFAITAAAATTAATLLSGEFFDHYAYFPAVFLAMVVGLALSRVIRLVIGLAHRAVAGGSTSPGDGRLSHAVPALVSAALAVALAAWLAPPTVRYGTAYLAGNYSPTATVRDAGVPEGACVVSDNPELAIASDRFSAKASGCPAVVDTWGTALAASPRHPIFESPPPESLRESWKAWFTRADYYLSSSRQSVFVPWNDDLLSWFGQNYVLVNSGDRVFVYRHVRPTPVAGTAP